MPKRKAIGIVTSDRASKTRRVEIPRLVRHPKYGKILRRKTVCYVHDEHNESHRGDTVEIVECPPKSRLKRWNLVRVLPRTRSEELAAVQQAERLQAEAGAAESSGTGGPAAPTN
jgi:small subunit ribosomal protein S17